MDLETICMNSMKSLVNGT